MNYETEEEIRRLVRDFESCKIAKTDFHHREHLIVAVWYVQKFSRGEAVARMRSGLLRFLEHHGVDKQKYSDTTTIFWIDLIAAKLEEIGADASLVDKCNQVVGSLSSTTRTPASRVEAEESPVTS
jgi:hypothetical protein